MDATETSITETDSDEPVYTPIKRTGRLHITSESGLIGDTSVTQADGTQLPFPVSSLHVWFDAGDGALRAKAICWLPSVDLLTDAEMELHTANMRAYALRLVRMMNYLKTTPPTPERDALLAETYPLLPPDIAKRLLPENEQ